MGITYNFIMNLYYTFMSFTNVMVFVLVVVVEVVVLVVIDLVA